MNLGDTGAAAPISPRPAGLFLSLFRASLREHDIFMVLALAYLVTALGTTYVLGLPWGDIGAVYTGVYGLILISTLGLFWLAHTLYVVLNMRPARPLRAIYQAWRYRFLRPERLALALPVLLLWPFYSAAYSRFKIMIPLLHPYNWDADFAAWDQTLHLGTAPWRWLQPLTDEAHILGAISFVYQLWFFVLYAIVLWQALSLRNRKLRMQFLLSNVLAWILLGNVAATWLAAGGPVYYARLTGMPDIYAPLFAHLNAVAQIMPIWSLHVQDMLWGDYAKANIAAGGGISAMPSLHVASSLLFMLVCWHTDRRLGALLGVFTLCIMVGSVSLGWHYAIDGYVGMAGAYLVWRAVGVVVNHRYGPDKS